MDNTNKGILSWWIILIIVVAAISGGIWYYTQPKTTSSPEEKPNQTETSDTQRYQPPPQDQGISGLLYFIPNGSTEKVPLGQSIISFRKQDDPSYVAQVGTDPDGLFTINIHEGIYSVCTTEEQPCQNVTVEANNITNIEIEFKFNNQEQIPEQPKPIE